jgi:regulator of sigma E protease
MDAVISIIAFIAVFSVLVFFHELGHFSVARWFGVRVDTFSIGFGKKLWSRTDRQGTEWKISAVPLGGYVKFFGDANEASTPSAEVEALSDAEKAVCFQFKPLWQRSLVVAAGPLANFILAAFIFAGMFMVQGEDYMSSEISRIVECSPAEEAGLQPGDLILSLDDYSVTTFRDVVQYTSMHPERDIVVTFERDGVVNEVVARTTAVTTTSTFGRTETVGKLGVWSTEIVLEERGPIEALWRGVVRTADYSVLIVKSIGQFIMGERSVKELGGPISIGEISGEMALIGFAALINFAALLSINLGIINLLPIPALDGGHLLFYAVEAIKRKPLGERAQEYGFRIGFTAIIALMLLVTWNDVTRLIDRFIST